MESDSIYDLFVCLSEDVIKVWSLYYMCDKLCISKWKHKLVIGLYTFKSIRYDTYHIMIGLILDTYHDTYR